ncbi:MAG TPA: low affinity iron permease family protein [Parafilimonas sp.]|nr:low affinity iron permease family protein [Parafilimonas sp.]
MARKKSKGKKKLGKIFDRFSSVVTRVTGKPISFIVAFLIIIVWAVSGPIFQFSDTWQLVINTGTTIITFLMVFVIQQSQNKDTVAIHLKLNELIAATKGASNRLIDVEDLTPEELDTLKKFYIKLSRLAEKENDLSCTHTIEEAEGIHRGKLKTQPEKKS